MSTRPAASQRLTHSDLYDFAEADVTYTRVATVGTMTAYAVVYSGTFVGYVVGRAGGWSTQPESDPGVPVEASHAFLFAYPSRKYVTDLLVREARDAGVIA